MRLYRGLRLSAPLLLAAAAAHAASLIPPRNLGELATTSEAVMLGEALRSRVVRRGPLLFTETTFLIDQRVKGEIGVGAGSKGGPARPELVAVEVPGGELDGKGWAVTGSPRFATGERYLLMLDRKDTATWQPRMLSFGIFREVAGRDGVALLAPLDEVREIQAMPRADGAAIEPPGIYRESDFLSMLGEVVRGTRPWDGAAVLASADQAPLQVSGSAPPSGCALELSTWSSLPNYPVRWPIFDSIPPGLVTIFADSTGDASVTGGGFSQVSAAVDTWNNIPNTSINLSYGGAQSYTLTCSSNPNDAPPSGTDMVVFNDPCNDIPDLSGCTGVLAFGGPWYSSTTHTQDGSPRYDIESQFVVVNNGVGNLAGCLSTGDYGLMMAHEFGHGLGFDHPSQTGDLMSAFCCYPVSANDTGCAQYYYPTSNPVPPSAPTGVSATDGTYYDRVRVSWNAAAGATSYKVYRNMVNNSAGATLVGSPGSSPYDDTLAVQGTPYYYWVKAHNSYGDSNFGGPDTGFARTCSAPAVPTASAPASAASGQSYNVSWTGTSPANTYEVQEATVPDFSGAATYSVTGLFRSFNHTVGSPTTYYYRVRASDCGGTVWSGYSSPVSTEVLVCGAPAAPALTAPAAVDSGTSYAVSWTGTSPDPWYELQEATNPAFNGAVTFPQAAASRSFTHTASVVTTYNYRVRARETCAGLTYWSAWSNAGSTLVSPCATPTAPVLTAPASASPGQSYAVSWTGTSPDPNYTLQEATDGGFTSPASFTQTGTSRSFSHSPAGNTTYYYRVKALNACGGTSYDSSWSNVGSTQVIVCTPPAAPNLFAPAAGAKVPGPTVTLSWGAVSGATSYDVHLGPGGGSPPFVANVTGTSYGAAVVEGESYSWEVVAKNACGQAASAVWGFTVCSAPGIPVGNFTWSPQGPAPGFPSQQQPYAGQTVQLSDLSTNSPTAWHWSDFQELAPLTFTIQNPSVTWTSAGGKNVRLIASNCAGASAEKLLAVQVYADIRPVTADFTWSPGSPMREVQITFSASQGQQFGDPSAFSWRFRDTNATATGAAATHTFACGGTFDVVLTAARGSYQAATTKSVSVGGQLCCPAPGVPAASFTWSPQGQLHAYPLQQQPYVGQVVTLTDTSTNAPTSWAWTGLPVGSASGDQDPTVVWTSAGTKTVSLTATNCAGSSTTAGIQIVVYPDVRPVGRRLGRRLMGSTVSGGS